MEVIDPEHSSISSTTEVGQAARYQKEEAAVAPHALDWTYSNWLHHEAAEEDGQQKLKKHLALTWRHLEVEGVDSGAVLGDDLISAVNPVEIVRNARKKRTRILLHDLNGQVRPGEMLLVLGRPGSGCTTFLKAVSNKREGYEDVRGDVFYGSMMAKEAKEYRPSILYNSEEDIHFPTLTVGQTLGFVLKTRLFRHVQSSTSPKSHVQKLFHVFSTALGISHTKDTLVGNEFVRGVSGGERKRVSIGEVMAAQGSITCWDNATRGLDASSALEFAQTLRKMAKKSQATVLATFYQAGNGIFNEFDKVLVLDSGRPIYYGPRELARSYFEDLGFVCTPGANVADFLTSVTVPTERKIRPGFEHTFPKTAEELEKIYRQSPIARMMEEDMVEPSQFNEHTAMFKEAIRQGQPKHKSPLQSSYTVGLWEQILACMVRQAQIMMGDRASMAMQQISATIQALVVGSLYYNLPATSQGLFTRTGALFFPIVFFSLTAIAEVTASFMGRTILSRHRDFGLYRPTAYVIARMIIDIPVAILQVSLFSIIYYFMCGFQMDAGKFFTFWLIVIAASLSFTSLFRMTGSMFSNFDNASKVSGFLLMIVNVYGGYFIPYNSMHPWFKWYFWLDPAGYTYEALITNEFSGMNFKCTSDHLVPTGDGYSSGSPMVCTLPGATADQTAIVGEDYVSAEFGFSSSHIWRNFGILIAWWVFFTAITALALERLNGHESGKSSLVFHRTKAATKKSHQKGDEEKGFSSSSATSVDQSANTSDLSIARNEAIFTWENLCYTVNVPGGQRQLLHNITGWVKPGQLGALMGSSGAGKTTLLDVLAKRKDVGVITGSVLVDGRPLPQSFQRSAGYCEQMDVHEGTATVLEALLFSARLRQPRETPDEEKVAYVQQVIRLLELEDIQHALIGVPGAGLTVEQRKRVTIGVELAAKPTILLFLDEPTSGLDGQSAFNVVRFLRRLTEAGQAVLCTIHQPSAALFDAFDCLLLLAKGGKTVYFGETGESSQTVLSYFAENGAPCDPDANPAEHIIDVVSRQAGSDTEWHEKWLASPQHEAMKVELERIKAEALSKPSTIKDDGRKFATPLMTQLRLVTHRANVGLWRNPEYVWNKIFLHISNALIAGFTFWMMGDNVIDLQLRLLAVFNFLFVAVGVISQLQPFFIHNRDIFEAREKKSQMYSWLAFVTAQLISEIPYLIICGFLYFACWYFTSGLPVAAGTSGQVFFTMIIYEFLYTAIGQAIAAISPNAFFASLLNPVILGAFLVGFAGVLVPYSQINVFWRYWMYWLDPYNYLIGALSTQLFYDVEVHCSSGELYSFSPPSGETCGEYMARYFETGIGYIVDNSSTTLCQYCEYRNGGQYAAQLNLNHRYDGWRDTGIVVLFAIATYGFVFLMMKFRTKKTKSAKSD